MMHTKGKFKVSETDSYTAVALPLDSEYINVRTSNDAVFRVLAGMGAVGAVVPTNF